MGNNKVFLVEGRVLIPGDDTDSEITYAITVLTKDMQEIAMAIVDNMSSNPQLQGEEKAKYYIDEIKEHIVH